MSFVTSRSASPLKHLQGWLARALVIALPSAVPLTLPSSLNAAPPALVSVSPANGAVNVPATASIVFTFDQPMDEESLVPGFGAFKGSINLSPAIVLAPSWNDDSTVLTMAANEFTGAFQSGTKYTWTFNPAGAFATLKSAAGEAMVSITGEFTIGTGGGGGGTPTAECSPLDFLNQADGAMIDTDCYSDGGSGGTNAPTGSLTLSRSAHYLQFKAGAPKPGTGEEQKPFDFGAFARGEPGATVAAISVTPPGRPAVPLASSPGGFYSHTKEFDTLGALESEFPGGTYAFRVEANTGVKTGNLALPAVSGNIPEITNLAEAQGIDVTKPFVLRWKPFNTSGRFSTLTLTIEGFCSKATVFIAPNYCVPIRLEPTDTSITIPANTLKPSRRYRARLSYSSGDFNTNAIPGYSLVSLASAETFFPINDPNAEEPGGASTDRPTLSISPDGNQLLVTAPLGQGYSLHSSPNFGQWTKFATGTGAGTTPLPTAVPQPRGHHLFFRAEIP